MFKLVIQDDEGKTTVVPLIRDEITIGRKEGNTIRLTERNVSRRHARILRSNNEVQIEDLGSYNGIRVNNARIAERVALRISDQVQIGDYKLYLKAEGVEQVDDARTMPIERIENVGTATESMPAIAPANGTAPTPPAPIPATPAPITARGIGVADTDPAGRPVQTAAQIQAQVNPPTGYGKLVVLSSNFAGKEFELTRPQMIVGRTDENDLVVNHRSISRNHAKITRDTETQRYTISDLQSSNGVRVNGQDYGKVELRRGDVVDLGHVRLRFVEPGEDFVFSRDAVIADVEGTGSKRGMMVAVILAILVIGAIGVFFVVKKGDSPPPKGDTGSNNQIATGSDGSGSNAAVIPDVVPDAPNAVVPANADAQKIIADCDAFQGSGAWTDLNTCAARLKTVDPTNAETYRKKAVMEIGADTAKGKVQQDLKDEAYNKAKKDFEQIPADASIKKQMQDQLDAADDKLFNSRKAGLQKLAQNGKCTELTTQINQLGSQNSDVSKRLKADPDLSCKAVAIAPEDCSNGMIRPDADCKKQFCKNHPESSKCGGGPPPVANCDPEVLKNQGADAESRGDHGGAVSLFDQSLRCKQDAHVAELAFMSSCNGLNLNGARKYWKKLTPSSQTHVISIALRAHFTREQLDAP